jgi:hypothetical protein
VLTRLRPYLFLTVLGLLFFGDLVLHPTQVLYADHSDLLAMHLPMKRFLVRSWQQTGELPLWNPYSLAGMPFVHDVQVAAFYPLHGPLYLLPEERIGAALSWLVVLHVLIAGWCMYEYARWRGLDGMGALVAAVGYMFAGKWLLHVLAGGHYILTPLAWLPLVLLFLEQAIERRSFLRATWAGSVFALIILGTHPQMTLYAGVFIALWSVGGVRYRVRGLCMGISTALVAVSLSAVQLLPALEAAPETSRSVGVAARDIVAVAAPSLLGLIGPGWAQSWEDRGGLAVLWVAAAAMAPLLCRGRARFEAAVALLLLFFSVGGAALLQWLPAFRLFQIPVRMLMMLALPVALLAGRTTQALLGEGNTGGLIPVGRHLPSCRYARAALAWVLFACVLLAATSAAVHCAQWRQSQDSPATVFDGLRQVDNRAFLYWSGLLITIPTLGWLLGERCTLSRRAWEGVWLGVLLADLWTLAGPCLVVHPEAELYSPSDCIRYLVAMKARASHEHWRVLDRGLPGQPSSVPLGAALPMLGSVEIEPVLGYNSFDVRRYKEYLQFITDEDKDVRPREGLFGFPISDTFPLRNQHLVDLLGTRYLLQPADAYADLCEGAQPAARWRQVGDIHPCPTVFSFLTGGIQRLPPYEIYENQDALPRAFVVSRAVPLASRTHVLEQLKATDFRREVLLEGYPSRQVTYDGVPGDVFRPAEIRKYLPNRVSVLTSAETTGYLVLTDLWYPGWTCTVDDKPAEVHRADFLFRAVAVPAGSHEVTFRFVPVSYRWGKLITLVSIGLLTGGWVTAGLFGRVNRFKGQRSTTHCVSSTEA